jgi:hypothetical protein
MQQKTSPICTNLNDPVERWAILIGCSGGGDPIMEQLTINTMENYQTFLLEHGWRNESIFLLLEEEATTTAIMNTTFEWLHDGGEDENDIILFLFCTHGGPLHEDKEPYDEPDGRDEVIYPWDAEWGGMYLNTYIVDDDLAKKCETLHSNNVVLLFNTCFSGGMIDGSTDFCATGRLVLTSSAANELTIDSPTIMQSLFPYFIVKGLRGPADANDDGKISIEEAFQYSLFPVHLRSFLYSFLLPYVQAYVMHPQMYDGWPTAEDNSEELYIIE